MLPILAKMLLAKNYIKLMQQCLVVYVYSLNIYIGILYGKSFSIQNPYIILQL